MLIGESGSIGAPATTAHALLDAPTPFSIDDVGMLMTPLKDLRVLARHIFRVVAAIRFLARLATTHVA
jgi:hypothetical protein